MEVSAMAIDKRELLETLKAELSFIEQGGYGRSVRTPWKPTAIFQDSLSCLNFGDPHRSQPCDECWLMQFVPPERHAENVPCHHIPLNERGETVAQLELREDQARLEETLKNWLCATIRRLETELANEGAA
jgi:hypothetical protein